jgi:hypothetical protein
MKPSALALAALGLATACAPRHELCSGPTSCSASSDCVAGQCLPKNASFPYAGTRRLVLAPADIAVLDSAKPAGGALPPLLTLGRANVGSVDLLLRFDLHLDRGTTLLRASLMLDRSDAVPGDPSPVSLHAARVIGRWDPRTVSRSTAPPIEDLRLPRTLVASPGPTLVRIDVTELARRWLNHDPADQGVLVVAENLTATGVTFALGGEARLGASEDGVGAEEREALQAPRLEIYAR